MALSQVQCLDNNNVNWRSSEGKPEFFYSEEQRLALEALVSSGADSFHEIIKTENIRNFLSELELSKLACSVEPFDPDSGHTRTGCDKCEQERDDGENQEGMEHSLEYWPEKSDCVTPELDLGWPDVVAYRGVTRATVYMQPPIEGQPHIKEVVRKMITQAQKVIAVVMDLFTDVDIFKDLLEASFKRKVAVYIILNESDLQYFLQLCERAQMHKGHLKNLRVRSVGGSEFYTRFSTKFKGCLSQKFMFVDGDKAVCGSYSFTWSAARIDRNLITVLSGQVVESFDRQFQELYLASKGVSLKNVTMDNEPEPESVAKPAAMPVGPTEAIAKKLVNPKYGLVKIKTPSEKDKEIKQIAANKAKWIEQQNEESQIHPALQNMEKANMFDYLPTWVEPEPEPGSDILGYINIIDPNIKNAQLSQMNRIKICDTSHATTQFMLQNKELEMKQNEDARRNSIEDTSFQVNEIPCSEKKEHSQRIISRQGSGKKDSVNTTKSVSVSSSQDDLEKTDTEDHIDVGQKNCDRCPHKHNVGLASLATSNHLVPVNKVSGPPMPKPRTLPVTDFISMKNALNIKTVLSDKPRNESPVPSVNGVDTEVGEDEEIEDFIIQNEPVDNNQEEEEVVDDEDDGDTNGFELEPNDCSSSGSGSLPPSNASSMSEEYYPSTTLQRRSSDRIPNGERYPLERKLSDGHISRGTYAGPLGFSQTLLDMRAEAEIGKRRNQVLEAEIKRALSKDRTLTAEPTQGKTIFQLGRPITGYPQFQTQRTSRNPPKVKGKKDGPDVLGMYRHTGRKPEVPRGTHGFWSSKDYGNSLSSSHSQNPVPMENTSTPFGIPYSKLSQAKHLKSKLSGATLDSKRRSHGPPGHKDL
ncbi:protein FAM83G [Pelobates fuscus]|uniref:protein FAM83G n=1 Tax=Pelobates fuscus TaxID=191477 RepID=UPI002FE43F9B